MGRAHISSSPSVVRESDRCGRGVAFGDLHVRSVRRGHVTPSGKGMTKEGIIISVFLSLEEVDGRMYWPRK